MLIIHSQLLRVSRTGFSSWPLIDRPVHLSPSPWKHCAICRTGWSHN